MSTARRSWAGGGTGSPPPPVSNIGADFPDPAGIPGYLTDEGASDDQSSLRSFRLAFEFPAAADAADALITPEWFHEPLAVGRFTDLFAGSASQVILTGAAPESSVMSRGWPYIGFWNDPFAAGRNDWAIAFRFGRHLQGRRVTSADISWRFRDGNGNEVIWATYSAVGGSWGSRGDLAFLTGEYSGFAQDAYNGGIVARRNLIIRMEIETEGFTVLGTEATLDDIPLLTIPEGTTPLTTPLTFPGTAQPNGYRDQVRSDLPFVVVHTSESPPANGLYNTRDYLLSPAAGVAYHGLVGATGSATLIANDAGALYYLDHAQHRAYHARAAGNPGFGLAFCVRTTDWRSLPTAFKDAMYHGAANLVVPHMRRANWQSSDIQRITRLGTSRGFIAHGDLQADRSDPGSAFEWDRFLNFVRLNF